MGRIANSQWGIPNGLTRKETMFRDCSFESFHPFSTGETIAIIRRNFTDIEAYCRFHKLFPNHFCSHRCAHIMITSYRFLQSASIKQALLILIIHKHGIQLLVWTEYWKSRLGTCSIILFAQSSVPNFGTFSTRICPFPHPCLNYQWFDASTLHWAPLNSQWAQKCLIDRAGIQIYWRIEIQKCHICWDSSTLVLLMNEQAAEQTLKSTSSVEKKTNTDDLPNSFRKGWIFLARTKVADNSKGDFIKQLVCKRIPVPGTAIVMHIFRNHSITQQICWWALKHIVQAESTNNIRV